MKKYVLTIAVGFALTLAACGSGSTTEEKNDSTSAVADTTVKAQDSVVAPVDSVAGGAKVEAPVK